MCAPPPSSSTGISGRSQILFLVTYVARYLDLFTNFVSVYNSAMKVFFISASAATVYLMLFKFKATYDHNHDTLRSVAGDADLGGSWGGGGGAWWGSR